MGSKRQEVVLKLEKSERIDKALAHALGETRSVIQQWLKQQRVTINGEVVRANYKAKDGEVVIIESVEEDPMIINPENIPLTIIYEDDDLLVINKNSGMVVHPSKGHLSNTLVNALLHHVNKLSPNSDTETFRPGIVHRIDKDTSGLLVVAKTAKAHLGLSEQLMNHSMKRTYLALVSGKFEHETGTIDAPLLRHPTNRLKRTVSSKGKKAITHFTVVEQFPKAALLRLNLETGRTHQIRAHMEFIHHPILNDPMYSTQTAKITPFGQFLHAESLGFIHPITQETLYFTSEPPSEFQEKILELRSERGL